tara:strand:+ start:1135 stop:1716 length:582 start_codon:yes stop_codon:yes gene_type:complete
MEISITEALNRGIKAQRMGRLSDARQIYLKILETNPNHPDVHHNMAILEKTDNRLNAAKSHFKTALKNNPKVRQYWLSYLHFLLELDDKHEAANVYMEAQKRGITEDPFQKVRQQLDFSENLKTTLPDLEDPSRTLLRTKEVASAVGIHKDTLLRWLRKGFVAEPQRDRNGWRVFTQEEKEAIRRYANDGTVN